MTTAVVGGLIAAGGAVLAAVIAALVQRRRDQGGRILSPTKGEELPRKFLAIGELAAIPRSRHVWLAVRIDDLIFPKEPEISSKDLRWAHDVFEGGNPPVFSLALLLVNREGQREIRKWLREGAPKNSYPGLNSIPGSMQLDIVPGLKFREKAEREKEEREKEDVVMGALRHLRSNQQFRTAEGIAEEVGMTVNEVRSMLSRHPADVRVSRLPDLKGRVLYQFRERSIPPH